MKNMLEEIPSCVIFTNKMLDENVKCVKEVVMSDDLMDLVKTVESLCESLERAAEDEKKFCYQVCHELEKMRWQMDRHAQDLKSINDYVRG